MKKGGDRGGMRKGAIDTMTIAVIVMVGILFIVLLVAVGRILGLFG